jgi:hypothetical protein
MLRKILNINLNILSQQQSKCLIHLNTKLLNTKKTDSTTTTKNDNRSFEDFQEPSKFLNLKQLEKAGLAKDYWSWPKYNRTIYPPQSKDEPRRNAFVHHMRTYIKGQQKTLWYPAVMIRGMTIDEAIKQLSFQKSLGAEIIKEVFEI